MKKFNITTNVLAIIALTCCVWICVLFAAAFALRDNDPYFNTLVSIIWLYVATLLEWIKYRIYIKLNNYVKVS